MLNFKKTIMLGLIIALFTLPAMFFVQGCRSSDVETTALVTDNSEVGSCAIELQDVFDQEKDIVSKEDYIKALFNLANKFAEKRKFRFAMDMMDRILVIESDNEDAKYLRNMFEQAYLWRVQYAINSIGQYKYPIEVKQGVYIKSTKEEKSAIDSVVENEPKEKAVEILLHIADELSDRGRFESAVNAMDRLLEIDSENAEAKKLRNQYDFLNQRKVKYNADMNDNEKPSEQHANVQIMIPPNENVVYSITDTELMEIDKLIVSGERSLTNKKYEEAKVHFLEALKIYPNNKMVQELLIVAQYHINHQDM